MKTEHRNAVLYHVIDRGLKLAKQTFEEKLKEPLKQFLLDLPAKARRDGFEVAGMVKAYIQEDRAHEVLDNERIVKDFQESVAKGGVFSIADLKELLATGAISVANPELIAQALIDRKVSAGYTVKVPGGGRPALKVLTLDKGQLEGVENLLKGTVDFPGSIENVVNGGLDKAIEAQLSKGTVALQRP